MTMPQVSFMTSLPANENTVNPRSHPLSPILSGDSYRVGMSGQGHFKGSERVSRLTLCLETPWTSGAQEAGVIRMVKLAIEVTRTVFLWHSWGVIAVEQRHEE